MADPTPPTHRLDRQLKRPLLLTWTGLWAERLARAFWPVWSVLAALAALAILGLHEAAPPAAVRAVAGTAAVAALALGLWGLWRFARPRRSEALARIDAALPGRPLAALTDSLAVGRGDPGSERLWQAHRLRMRARAAQARAIAPDLRLARRDPFGLRYVALLMLVVALLFGSVWRLGSVSGLAPGGGAALAAGPVWEGWVEPPAYTGLPSLYLQDQGETLQVAEGSRITLRLYGELGALEVSETVSGRGGAAGGEDGAGGVGAPEQSFSVAQPGTLRIIGPGGRDWQIGLRRDAPPEVEIMAEGARTSFEGQMSQPFRARDDYGIRAGTAVFNLDLDAVTRRHGLAVPPEPRDPIALDLPMPMTGDRAEFTESLVENLSKHPWAHLPVRLRLSVRDAADQEGRSAPQAMALPARRFFDPLAAALIEQRRDLLWSRANARRVAQVLRAVSHDPEPRMFRDDGAYLRLRVLLRRLERHLRDDSFTPGARDAIAEALWDLAIKQEDGDVGDALERMRAAQERLSEAMKNGASADEIAQLMQELRDATQDYLRQKAQQAQRDTPDGGSQQNPQDMMQMSSQDLQDMMDRIQELMEQGRFAEAQQALEEFQQMMENMQVTQGEGGQGQSPGQQAMEGLAETLRDQQGLSDQAFRDLQEQFNPGAQAGRSQGNEGRSGGEGRGRDHEGAPGRGDGQGAARDGGEGGEAGRDDAGPGAGTLADRQEALRRQLERQRGGLPPLGGEAGAATREALERAERAMEGAEGALRGDDLAGALDQQSRAMEALRDGMRNMGEALAEQRNQAGQGEAFGQLGQQQADPLGRRLGQGGNAGTQDNLLQGDDVYRRARDLLDEIRRRSGEGARPDVELEYLRRLLDRF